MSIINLNKTKGNFPMEQKDFNKTEKIKLTKDVRVRVKGEDTAKLYKAGDTVSVSGNDKVQLIGSKAGERLQSKETKK